MTMNRKGSRARDKSTQGEARRPSLTVISVMFNPTPGSEQRLGRVYQILLAHSTEQSRAADEYKEQQSLQFGSGESSHG